jgi:RNA polymerase sigma-70 factor, ECF subfamily
MSRPTIEWDALCASLGPALRRVAQSVLRDEHEAEDAVQEALLAAWEASDQLRDPDAIEAWLLKIARNTAFERLRSGRTRRACLRLSGTLTGEGAIEPEDRRATPPGHALEVREALETLSPALHRAATKRLQGLSMKELAAAEGTSVGAVKTRLSRARAHLREKLR